MPLMRRILVAATVLVLLVVGMVVVVGLHLTGEVGRVPAVFTGLRDRPNRVPGAAAGSVNVLLVGTYGPGGSTWLPGHRRPMNLMVVHLDADRRAASVVALPLGARVPVPGHGVRNLGAVFDLGGPSLAVGTVESLTGTRVDHLAVLDWRAVEQLVERLGGLELAVSAAETDDLPTATGVERTYVDGKDVIGFAGPGSGVDEVAQLHRQLIVLDEAMRGSLHQSMHKRPLQAYRFADEVASHLAVESGWSAKGMARLAASLWSLRSADIRYAAPPVTCVGREPTCRPRLDVEAGPAFWQAVGNDRLDAWLAAHDDRGLANQLRATVADEAG